MWWESLDSGSLMTQFASHPFILLQMTKGNDYFNLFDTFVKREQLECMKSTWAVGQVYFTFQPTTDAWQKNFL